MYPPGEYWPYILLLGEDRQQLLENTFSPGGIFDRCWRWRTTGMRRFHVNYTGWDVFGGPLCNHESLMTLKLKGVSLMTGMRVPEPPKFISFPDARSINKRRIKSISYAWLLTIEVRDAKCTEKHEYRPVVVDFYRWRDVNRHFILLWVMGDSFSWVQNMQA